MPRLLLATIFASVLPLSAVIPNPVRVEQGQLAGVPGNDPAILVFKGVPYAAPPVGDLRWRPPKPAADWKGVRKADRFSAVCMQTPYPQGSLYYHDAEPMGEDCLYLNIWTAAKSVSAGRPVMVWIHGGALTRGSGSLPTYDGEALASKGVVVVTVNYRLGVFGFFAHPALTAESPQHASGNYGFLDQIAALQWVKANIAKFGGDPNHVTIFGESAGSWSVNALVASPLGKGLFQRAIGESGANFSPLVTLAEAEKAGAKLGESIGADSLAALRAKSAEELLKLSVNTIAIVDGWVLPDQVREIFVAGKQNDVPTLIGSNADEGTAFTPPAMKAETFRAQAQRVTGDKVGEFLKIYPANSDEEAWKSAAASMRDSVFGLQMRTWARMQTKTGKSKAYLYYFNRVPPGLGSEHYGSFHASEIAYVFNNLNKSKRHWEEIDHKLADVMSLYWVNFATSGDPNGPGLPAWSAYSESKDEALGIGDKIGLIPVPNKAGIDLFERIGGRIR